MNKKTEPKAELVPMTPVSVEKYYVHEFNAVVEATSADEAVKVAKKGKK